MINLKRTEQKRVTFCTRWKETWKCPCTVISKRAILSSALLGSVLLNIFFIGEKISLNAARSSAERRRLPVYNCECLKKLGKKNQELEELRNIPQVDPERGMRSGGVRCRTCHTSLENMMKKPDDPDLEDLGGMMDYFIVNGLESVRAIAFNKLHLPHSEKVEIFQNLMTIMGLNKNGDTIKLIFNATRVIVDRLKERLVRFLEKIKEKKCTENEQFKKLIANLDISSLSGMGWFTVGLGKFATRLGMGNQVAGLTKWYGVERVEKMCNQVITKLKELEFGNWLPLMTRILGGDRVARQRRKRRKRMHESAAC